MNYPMFVSTAAAITLSGCNSEVDNAQRRYETVKHSSARADEICAAGASLVQAYLNANDAEAYRQQQIMSAADCSSARLDEQYGRYRDINGNVMESPSVEHTDRLAGLTPPSPEAK